MADSQSTFLELACSSKVVRPAVKVSIIVGTLLALINHGGSIFRLALSSENLLQIALTYLVPYCVSTYSSVKAIQSHAGMRS